MGRDRKKIVKTSTLIIEIFLLLFSRCFVFATCCSCDYYFLNNVVVLLAVVLIFLTTDIDFPISVIALFFDQVYLSLQKILCTLTYISYVYVIHNLFVYVFFDVGFFSVSLPFVYFTIVTLMM